MATFKGPNWVVTELGVIANPATSGISAPWYPNANAYGARVDFNGSQASEVFTGPCISYFNENTQQYATAAALAYVHQGSNGNI